MADIRLKLLSIFRGMDIAGIARMGRIALIRHRHVIDPFSLSGAMGLGGHGVAPCPLLHIAYYI